MSNLRFGLIALLIVVVDWLTKRAIMIFFAPGETRPLIDGIVYLTYAQNRGAAFSILQGRSQMLTVIGIVLVLVLIFVNYHYRLQGWIQGAVALIIGGALGNIIDRLSYGYVTDMIDLHWWPIFNMADAAIVIGGLLLIFCIWKKERTF